MSFQVRVDPTNAGQFFACCGLLELANRLWQGVESLHSMKSSGFFIGWRGKG